MRFRGVTTTFILALVCCCGLSARPQEKPLTQEQVINLVKHQFGDARGARSIERRGIDFDPTPEFIESLKDAGANDVFTAALQNARHPSHAASKTLSRVQVLALLGGQVPSHRVAMLVAQRGIDFTPDDGFLNEVSRGGGDHELLGALRTARVSQPASVDPAAAAKEMEVRQHVARYIEFRQKTSLPMRSGKSALPCNCRRVIPPCSRTLAVVLQYEDKWTESIDPLHEALRYDPNYGPAHASLGSALGMQQDLDGAIAQFHEAIRIDPNDNGAHYNLGVALMMKHDANGAIAEYREAIRINPAKMLPPILDWARGSDSIRGICQARWNSSDSLTRLLPRMKPTSPTMRPYRRR